MNGQTHKGAMLGTWAGLATLAAAGVVALVALGQSTSGVTDQQVAELKTIIVPPPPPPPVDSGTVDLRDKKGPLIPHIPSVVLAPTAEDRLLACTIREPGEIFIPPPPPHFPSDNRLSANDPVKEGQERGQRELEAYLQATHV